MTWLSHLKNWRTNVTDDKPWDLKTLIITHPYQNETYSFIASNK